MMLMLLMWANAKVAYTSVNVANTSQLMLGQDSIIKET